MGDFNQPGDIFLADCPARLAVEIIADKWSVVVLYALSRGPRRHGELVDLIGGISRKVLTQTLRRLTRHGLVSRHAYSEVPPRVEYALTEKGEALVPLVEDMRRYGTRWLLGEGAESREPAAA